MSVQAIGWALGVETGKPGAKLVLLALANYADEDGVCWPSQARIARESEQSIDTVQRHLKHLEARGLVTRKRRQNPRGTSGGRRSDTYVLAVKPQNAACPDVVEKPQRLGRKMKEVRPQIAPSYKEEPSRTVNNKKLPPENGKGRRRSGERYWRSNEGAAEAAVAARFDALGINGWDVLLALPAYEVRHLCSKHRSGSLDGETLERVAGRCLDNLGGPQLCSTPSANLRKVDTSPETDRVLPRNEATRHAAPRKASKEGGFSKAEVQGDRLKSTEVLGGTS